MDPDRKIGRVVKVKTYQALVELLPETSSYAKSSYGGVYAIAAVNSYVILPIGSERIVAVVTGLDMVEEQEMRYQSRQMLVLPNSRRTMWVSMIGTIAQIPGEQYKRFEYGIRRYPELDNPVWFATEEDLDVIFQRASQNANSDSRLISIGTSPLFPQYGVYIDMDRLLGKHTAVLGSTGSGKSCTVAAVINAVLDQNGPTSMPHAHFIIFDTNAEYEAAFTRPKSDNSASYLHNRLVISNEGNAPSGFWVPHWFMDGRDYTAFFRPGEGAQGPLLHRAIGLARAGGQRKARSISILSEIERVVARVDSFAKEVRNAGFYAKKNIREQVDAILKYLEDNEPFFTALGWEQFQQRYVDCFSRLRIQVAADGYMTALVGQVWTTECDNINTILRENRLADMEKDLVPTGIDTPVHFDYDNFVVNVIREEIDREAESNPNLRSWVGSLLMRLDRARQDPRYQFLFSAPQFDRALASFLRLLFGVDPSANFDPKEAKPPWADEYSRAYPRPMPLHQVTILDLSRLASDVLENVTALLGRLILEFMQRCPNRGQYPVVLVLEEAHRYIPAFAPLERQERAREIFEKIAKEGRKYGLSLIVASQRPSELSRTVVSQCNSFIIHRIQNPDDRDYFKSVIPDINRELLDQLPALPQQHALVIGDCIKIPMQVRINNVDPKPHSHDPEFFRVWSSPDSQPPDFETICAEWEGRSPAAKPSSGVPSQSSAGTDENDLGMIEPSDYWLDEEASRDETEYEEDPSTDDFVFIVSDVMPTEPDWFAEYDPDLSEIPPDDDPPF